MLTEDYDTTLLSQVDDNGEGRALFRLIGYKRRYGNRVRFDRRPDRGSGTVLASSLRSANGGRGRQAALLY